MSFILEALKKSDSKRQDGTVPKLETVHDSVIQPRAKRPGWVWILLFVMILNAAVLLWLFAPWQQQASIAPDLGHTTVQKPPTTLESPVEEIKPQLTATPAATSVKEPAPIPSLPTRTMLSVESAQPTEKILQQPLSINTNEKSLRNTDPTTELQKIYSIKDLPISVKRDLPEMHMSVHAFYSNKPAASLIRINNQIIRTGARLTDKYVLEEITSEGAVFFYAGYRFLVPRKNLHK